MRRYPPRKPAPGTSGWSGRDRAAQRAFRRQVIADAGGTYCQECGAVGVPVQAHHDTQTSGRLLCDACHMSVDPNARASR